jgi:hypothetical protein
MVGKMNMAKKSIINSEKWVYQLIGIENPLQWTNLGAKPLQKLFVDYIKKD